MYSQNIKEGVKVQTTKQVQISLAINEMKLHWEAKKIYEQEKASLCSRDWKHGFKKLLGPPFINNI
jgi:hypothetical protein